MGIPCQGDPHVACLFKKQFLNVDRYVVPVVMSELEARIENEKRPLHRVDVTLAGGYDVDLNPASGIRATVSLAVSRCVKDNYKDAVFPFFLSLLYNFEISSLALFSTVRRWHTCTTTLKPNQVPPKSTVQL